LDRRLFLRAIAGGHAWCTVPTTKGKQELTEMMIAAMWFAVGFFAGAAIRGKDGAQ